MNRSSYTADFKLKAIEIAKSKGNREAAKTLKIDESMIRRWKKLKDNFKQIKKTKLSMRGSSVKWPLLEDDLERWIIEQRSRELAVSTSSIRAKAISIAEANNYTDFTGGISWCSRFMMRKSFSIRSRTSVGQSLPINFLEKKEIFLKYCTEKIEENKIHPCLVVNMDEVPMTFDLPMNRTVDKIGTKSISIKTTGNEKSSFTVVLSCCSDGGKLPPMVIFKRKTIPKENFSTDVIVEANEKGWMDENMMVNWLNKIYIKRSGGFFHTDTSLLIYDSMCAHITSKIKEIVRRTNSVLAVIPGGCTKLLQPLDISVNRSFKTKLRHTWEHWMSFAEHEHTPSGNLKRPSYSLIVKWISDAWADVTQSTIINGFEKSEIIQQLPGTENHSSENKSDLE